MRNKDHCPDCTNCEKLAAMEMMHDRQLAKVIKRDTDIINGLLREIEALHLLLQKQGNEGNDGGDDSCPQISSCQNMSL